MKLALLILKDLGGGGDPDAAVTVLRHCSRGGGGGKREGREAFAVEAEEAAAGEDQNAAGVVD